MSRIEMKEFVPTGGKIFVTEMERGMRKSRGGIIITDDNFKDVGVRPRWARVWRTSPDIDYVSEKEWVLVEHGRWTLKIELLVDGEEIDCWSIDPKAILLVSDSDECPAVHESYILGA